MYALFVRNSIFLVIQYFTLELYSSKTIAGGNQSDWIYDLTRALTISKSSNDKDKIIETVQVWGLNIL